MNDQQTHGLSVQHADALWDAVAIPGPTEPTFPMQHERVCRAVAEILDELTPAPPAVPVSSPPPDQTAEPDCRFEEGCHRVVPCDPGCAVAAAELHHRLTAVLPPPADRTAVLLEAAEALWNHPRASAIDSDFRSASDVLRRLAAEAQQQPTAVEPSAAADTLHGESVAHIADAVAPHCAGFPTTCPNPIPVPPAPPHHDGGIRCGCYDEEPRP